MVLFSVYTEIVVVRTFRMFPQFENVATIRLLTTELPMLSVEFQLFTREQCLHVLRQVVFGLLLKSAVPVNTCSMDSIAKLVLMYPTFQCILQGVDYILSTCSLGSSYPFPFSL